LTGTGAAGAQLLDNSNFYAQATFGLGDLACTYSTIMPMAAGDSYLLTVNVAGVNKVIDISTGFGLGSLTPIFSGFLIATV
jgi:hypothetical protein